MNGRDLVTRTLRSERPDRPPILPIVHSGLAALYGVPLGEYLTRAETMEVAEKVLAQALLKS